MGKRTQEKKLSINIGIDFGTCYSKVCFEDETKMKNYVKFYIDQPEYKISEVYYDYANKIFHYQKPKDERSIEIIKYFKYSMIDESLPHGIEIQVSCTKTAPEILCSVFFIACLLKESKEYIENHFKGYGILQFDWNITMGVPIDNYSNKIKPLSLYNLILQVAIKLSNDINKYSIPLDTLDSFYQENNNIPIPHFKDSPNNTLSELYAESLSFLLDDNVLEGLYAIVDIGGATVDMAVISKISDEDNQSNKTNFKYGIIAKKIIPLGIEILIHKISQNMDSYSSIRKLLENSGFKKAEIEYNKIEEEKLAKEMQDTFAKLAIDAKNKFREALIKRNGEMKVILCGGGAYYKWYESCIYSTFGRIKKTLADVPNGFRPKFGRVEELKRDSNINDHRLIISSGLAQDIQRIPNLDGFPWDYPEITYTKTNQDENLEERAKEIYGKKL